MKITKAGLAFSAIIVIALGLRLYGLGSESIWYDEGLSIGYARMDPGHMLEALSAKEVHPPLYYLVLHYWMSLFGDSEFSTRLLSVIFGVLAVFMVYKLGRMLFDDETAAIASVLAAVSPFYIYYSQETRMYIMAAFLALTSMYCFLKLLEEKKYIYSIGYVISTVSLIYTHYAGVLIIITQNIYFFTLFLFSRKRSRPSFRKWALLQFVTATLFTPWLMILLRQAFGVITPSQGVKQYLLTPPKLTLALLLNFFSQCSGTILLAYIFLILSVFSLINIGKKKLCLLSIWLLSVFLIPIIVPRLTTLLYFAKYLIANSMALIFLAARGIANIRIKLVKYAVIAGIVVLSLLNVREIYLKVNNEPWKEAAIYVEKNAEPGDLLIFSPPYFLDSVFNYYSKRADLVKNGFPPEDAGTTYVSEENIGLLYPILEGHRRVWFIQSHIHDLKGLIPKTLLSSYRLADEKKYYTITYFRPPIIHVAIKIYLFERKY